MKINVLLKTLHPPVSRRVKVNDRLVLKAASVRLTPQESRNLQLVILDIACGWSAPAHVELPFGDA